MAAVAVGVVVPRVGKKSPMVIEQSSPKIGLHCSKRSGNRYDCEPRIRESVVKIPQSSSRGSVVDSVRWRSASVGGFGACFEGAEVVSV